LARPVWFALAVATLVALAAGVQPLLQDLQAVCTENCPVADWQAVPAGAAALTQSGFSLQTYAALVTALLLISAALWIAPAALLAWQSANRPFALFGAFFLLTVGAELSAGLLNAAAIQYPGLSVLVTGVQVVAVVTLGAFFFVFPDGRFVPGWTKWLVLGWIASQLPGQLAPGTWLDSNTWPPAAFLPAIPGYFLVGLGVLIWRYRRRSNAVQRQQTKWALYGFVLGLGAQNLLLGFVTLGLHGSVPVGSPGFLVGIAATRVLLLLIPMSMALAILRYRLWDIDVLINRTLVYASMMACVVGLYLLVVGYLGLVFRSQDSPLLSLAAAALVAVLFQPLRLWLQRLVNRLIYGQRDEPYAVLARLGRRLEDTMAPEAALVSIVQTIREALRLPYAALVLEDHEEGRVVATAGEPVAHVERWPLTYQQQAMGELLIAPRAPGEQFGPADRRLLHDLSRQAGTAVHAVRLTSDLRQARERLVTAREEERRRLRRDLHDGLGPQLASQALTIDAARSLMQRDPQAADRLLIDLKLQSQAAVADVRRLVDGLRPPALDDLGLVGALRAAAAALAHGGLDVAVAAPQPLPPLPAAVEVAAFRIIQEAITNVVRHAGATHASVDLELAEGTPREVRVEVRDNGVGFERDVCPGVRSGLGLTSMRERAEEVGGRLTVNSTSEGTIVHAWLPLSESL
jgi:signal transduction histidine kinase